MFSDALEISFGVGDLGHRQIWMVTRAMLRMWGASNYINNVSHPKSACPFGMPDLTQNKRRRKK